MIPPQETPAVVIIHKGGQGYIQAAMMSIREKNLSHHGIFRVEPKGDKGN